MQQIKPNSVVSIKDHSVPDSPENWFDKVFHNDKPGTLNTDVETVAVKKHGYVGDDKRYQKGAKHTVKMLIGLGDTSDVITNAIKKKLLAGSSVADADNAGVTDVTITGGSSINQFEIMKFDVKLTYLNNENGNDMSYVGNGFWLKNAYEIKDGDNITEGYALEFESSSTFTFTVVDKVTTPTP
jgi:hypothetical protein